MATEHVNGQASGRNGAHLDFKIIAKAALSQADILLPRWLPGGKWEGHEYVARNPTRADKSSGSFKIDTKTGMWKDFAGTEKGGRDLIDLRAMLDGVQLIDAAKRMAAELGIETGPAKEQGVTLEAYAEAKRLPLDFLRELGLETVKNPYGRDCQALAIPYRDAVGELMRTRYRVAMHGKNKAVWDQQKGNPIGLYGCKRR